MKKIKTAAAQFLHPIFPIQSSLHKNLNLTHLKNVRKLQDGTFLVHSGTAVFWQDSYFRERWHFPVEQYNSYVSQTTSSLLKIGIKEFLRQIAADSAVSTCIASEVTSLPPAGSCHLLISGFLTKHPFKTGGTYKKQWHTRVMPSGSEICLPSLTPLPLLRTVPLIQVFMGKVSTPIGVAPVGMKRQGKGRWKICKMWF